MIRVFKSSLICDLLSDEELASLVNDFKAYKYSGVLPDNFGRDVAYDHPNTLPIVKAEKLQHIHLGNSKLPFPCKSQFHRTSDVHLVYCQGAMSDDIYLLMTILSSSSHELVKSRNIMYQLAKMAEQFRNIY